MHPLFKGALRVRAQGEGYGLPLAREYSAGRIQPHPEKTWGSCPLLLLAQGLSRLEATYPRSRGSHPPTVSEEKQRKPF